MPWNSMLPVFPSPGCVWVYGLGLAYEYKCEHECRIANDECRILTLLNLGLMAAFSGLWTMPFHDYIESRDMVLALLLGPCALMGRVQSEGGGRKG